MEELRFSEYCANCKKSLQGLERILFVEKEVGRCFCTEQCIKDYFQPIVEMKFEDWRTRVKDYDYNENDFSKFVSFRSLTLEDPDEIWVEKTEVGEKHFTYIAKYKDKRGEEPFHFIVNCLAIDGTPSFVFLSIPTRDEDLVQYYRKGQEIKLPEKESRLLEDELFNGDSNALEKDLSQNDLDLDEIASDENHDEALSTENLPLHLVEMVNIFNESRNPRDIPRAHFEKFTTFIDATLDDPNEIWQCVDTEGSEWLTFIATHTTESDDEFYMVVICEVCVDEMGLKSLELAMSFPSIDPTLPARFRKGIATLNDVKGTGRAVA